VDEESEMGRIHAVCVVRDEGDVIGACLEAALHWADTVYVLDNGSTDGTWEALRRIAQIEPRVQVLGQHLGSFSNALRPRIATRFLDRAELGDWWAWLDADEFFLDDPRAVLARVPIRYGVVHSASIEYYFTDQDLQAYESDPEQYAATWTPDTPSRYVAAWGEARFFRHVPGASWPVVEAQASAPVRVRLRHVQYRTPPQIDRRLRARLDHGEFLHETATAWSPTGRMTDLVFASPSVDDPLWHRRVVRAAALQLDAKDGNYKIAWGDLPSLSGHLSPRRLLLRQLALCRLRLAMLQPPRRSRGGRASATAGWRSSRRG
jgi:glycosyltransferase involved in cell wall biosynthesis